MQAREGRGGRLSAPLIKKSLSWDAAGLPAPRGRGRLRPGSSGGATPSRASMAQGAGGGGGGGGGPQPGRKRSWAGTRSRPPALLRPPPPPPPRPRSRAGGTRQPEGLGRPLPPRREAGGGRGSWGALTRGVAYRGLRRAPLAREVTGGGGRRRQPVRRWPEAGGRACPGKGRPRALEVFPQPLVSSCAAARRPLGDRLSWEGAFGVPESPHREGEGNWQKLSKALLNRVFCSGRIRAFLF